MRKYKIDLIIIIASLIIAGIIYPILPAQIPYHFQLNGETKTCAKEFVFLMALLPELIYRSLLLKYGKKG